MNLFSSRLLLFVIFLCAAITSVAQADFKVIGFYTARADQAHISFVHEAHKWFSAMGKKHHFQYDSTNVWDNLNPGFLSRYQVVIFLDTRPEKEAQREAFKQYMKNGGGWIGFHFAGFALTPSDFPQNWDWYHNEFIGAGQYVSNTWRPVSAILRVENRDYPMTKDLPATFRSSPSEWYRWEKDLRKNPDIKILLSVDSSSFPLGTGPKPHEIWHSGYYPIGWTNTAYRMVYYNMGHNDIDYEHKTNKTLSYTFGNETQDKLILESVLWLGKKKKKEKR
jgi:hypothetical protein